MRDGITMHIRHNKVIIRLIQVLILIIFALVMTTFITNLSNTSIGYNKYETTLKMQETRINSAQNMEVLRNEALESIELIRENDKEKHRVALMIFLSLLLQAILLFFIFLLSLFIQKKDTSLILTQKELSKEKLYFSLLPALLILGTSIYLLFVFENDLIASLLVYSSYSLCILLSLTSLYLMWMKNIYWLCKTLNALLIIFLTLLIIYKI